MKELLTFAADAAIINRLGRELVAKQETALIELVKNSFDADATHLDVVLAGEGPSSSLELRDDGIGMTRDDLVNGFLRLASNLKVQSPRSPIYNRQRAGRKGIGRFATQRLGDKLILSTHAVAGAPGLRLTADWTQFTAGRDLQSVGVELERVAPGPVGTTIRVEQLCDGWTDAQVRRCWRGVVGLQQPFPVAKVEANPSADPGFNVRFLREDMLFADETVVADLQTEILDHLHAVIELAVDGQGSAKWRIERNRFGDARDWRAIHHERLESATPPPYAHLRDVAMKAYYVILSAELLPSLVYSRVRDVLADHGGIRLYRNGFRVVPYGDSDNDWLRLDEMYTKRSFLAPLANRNFFGFIEVRDPAGSVFEEHTSREGLIENPAFSELKELASSVLVTAANQISEDRGRKTKAGSKPKSRPQQNVEVLDELQELMRAAQQAATRAADDGASQAARVAAETAESALRLLAEKKDDLEASEAQLADEAAMLRFLATLGMTTAEFSHETGMTFEAFRMDFQRVFEAVQLTAKSSSPLYTQAERAKGMLDRLDTLTSYLNTLASARSVRGMREISVSKAAQQFVRGMELQAKTQSIELLISAPPYDPLFTRPMHEAEVASVLLNLYTNAVKAIKRGSGERRILIALDRVPDDGSVRIQFYDSGDGVAEENLERIFDAFFTTRASPPAGAAEADHATGTGLGLWIVHQIVSNAGGEVSALSPVQGFSTCIEARFPAGEDGG